MAQFDLYVNTDEDTNKICPHFYIQNDLFDSINSRVVIPLTPVGKSDKAYPRFARTRPSPYPEGRPVKPSDSARRRIPLEIGEWGAYTSDTQLQWFCRRNVERAIAKSNPRFVSLTSPF